VVVGNFMRDNEVYLAKKRKHYIQLQSRSMCGEITDAKTQLRLIKFSLLKVVATLLHDACSPGGRRQSREVVLWKFEALCKK